MNWMRYTATGIGIVFGILFVIFAIGEGLGGNPNPQDCVLLLLGPISMVAGTAVAWRHERIGGWWLIAGGVTTGILFTIRLIGRPMDLLGTFLVYPLPMLVAGVLWVLHEAEFAKAAK